MLACGSEATPTDGDVAESELRVRGRLDRSFGVDGTLRVEFGDDTHNADDTIDTVTELADGKVLVAGSRSHLPSGVAVGTEVALTRYLANGHLDVTFGSAGHVETSVPTRIGPRFVHVHAAREASDGKIVVLASQRVDLPEEGGVVVLRYEADGTLDATFGAGGIVRTNLGATNLPANADGLVLQPDGRIVVVGRGQSVLNGGGAARLVRLMPDGSADASFATPDLPRRDIVDVQVIGLPDGGMYVGYATTLLRLDASGAIDAAFTQAPLPDGLWIRSLALSPDGSVLVAGAVRTTTHATGYDFFVARYATDGARDTTFGTDGIRTVMLEASAKVIAVAPAAGNRVLLAGELQRPGRLERSYFLTGLAANGSTDLGWGDQGYVEQPLTGELVDGSLTAVFTKRGRILVAGAQGSFADRDGFIRRYLP